MLTKDSFSPSFWTHQPSESILVYTHKASLSLLKPGTEQQAIGKRPSAVIGRQGNGVTAQQHADGVCSGPTSAAAERGRTEQQKDCTHAGLLLISTS